MPAHDRESLLQIGRAYNQTRLLLTGAELDIFTLLSNKSLDIGGVAGQLGGADERALTILLDALTALGLLQKTQGRYACPPELSRYLSAQREETVLPMLRHQAAQWRKWSRLTDMVRRAAGPETGERAPEDLRAFIGAMHVVSQPQAEALARVVDPGGARRLLDIGAGPGTYTTAFLRRSPDLHATVFDQPDVVEMARARLSQSDVADRVTYVGGDFYEDELPAGHDLALLSAIIHQNSRAQNVALYEKAHRALTPGGRLIIRDFVLEPDRTRPPGGAVFAVNMLVSTEGGNCYTFEEIRTDLEHAGFQDIHELQKSEEMAGVVEAKKR